MNSFCIIYPLVPQTFCCYWKECVKLCYLSLVEGENFSLTSKQQWKEHLCFFSSINPTPSQGPSYETLHEMPLANFSPTVEVLKHYCYKHATPSH